MKSFGLFDIDGQRSKGEQKWLSPCTKPAFEAEILVPTIVKLSNRCQSDQNHLVPPNIAGAKKILVPKILVLVPKT